MDRTTQNPSVTSTGPYNRILSPLLFVFEGFQSEFNDRWRTVRRTLVEKPLENAAWKACCALQGVRKWTISAMDLCLEQITKTHQEKKLQDDELARFDGEGGGQCYTATSS